MNDARTYSFTLPTYADDDPKAGQPVSFGDIVWSLSPEDHGTFGIWGQEFGMVSFNTNGAPVFYYKIHGVPEYGSFGEHDLFFSTEEAADTASDRMIKEFCK